MIFRPKSIFHRLLLAFLFVGLSTGGLLALVSVISSKESTLHRSRQNAEQQINEIATGFEQEFGVSLRRAIKAAAVSDTLKSYVTGNEEERVIAVKALESTFLRLVEDYDIFSSAYYVNADAEVMVQIVDGKRQSKPGPIRLSRSDTSSEKENPTNTKLVELFETLKTTPLLLSSGNMEWFIPPREVSVRDVYVDESGNASFLAGIATLDIDNGAFGGAVIIRIRLDKFIARLKSIRFLDENPVWLLDANRVVLARPDEMKSTFDPGPYFSGRASAKAAALEVPPGLLAYRDLSVVPGKPFLRIAYAIPSDVLNRDFDPTLRFFVVVLILSTITVFLVAFWISRNLAKPIVQLAAAASGLAQGKIASRVDVTSSGELRVLVDSFNTMSANLQRADRRRSSTFEVLRRVAVYLQEEGAAGGRAPEDLKRLLGEISDDSEPGTDGAPDDLRTVSSLIVRLFSEREENVAQIRRAISAAEEANKAKGDFLATMSHEIRTPLNAVIGLADVLATTSLAPEQRRLVETMESAGRQLLQIVNDVLDFSRISAGRVEVDEGTLDLKAAIERLMFVVAGLQGTTKQLDIRCDVSPDIDRPILADGQRLTQILTNLLGNALKFTEHGSVELLVRADKLAAPSPKLVFLVKDTGKGVPEHMWERIFEPFRQVGEERFEPHAGSGLGLAICRQLARAMGGDVTLDQSSPAGSTFRLEIPLRFAESGAGAGAAPATGASVPGRCLKVLVAEDTPASQLVIQLMLQRLGHEVTVVDNGLLAVEAFARADYDVVFLDLQMPVMNGHEAAQAIRGAGERGRQVKLVALTAFAQTSDREAALAVGIDLVVTKPVKGADISRVLGELFAGPP